MDHYENILDNSSYEGDDKYTEGDDFFAFLFKNMKKQEATPPKEPNTEPKPETDAEKEPDADPNKASAALLQKINDDGRIYLTQTLHDGAYVIRFVAGQFDCTRKDVMMAYDVITELAQGN